MIAALFLPVALAQSTWQQPPPEILEVLHAPGLPTAWTSPDGSTLLLADPVVYPPLAERAAPRLDLAGIRVDPTTHGFYAARSSRDPRLQPVLGGPEIPLALPADLRVLDVDWSADGQRFALTVRASDHIGLWVGDSQGGLKEIQGVELNPLLGSALQWTPDQQSLLVKLVPPQDPPPDAPLVPPGPTIFESTGGSPRSTYEARDLLQSAHDDALFTWYATSSLARVNVNSGVVTAVGDPGIYAGVSPSPDGEYLLVLRMMPPWSHETAWRRFAVTMELWTAEGAPFLSPAHRDLSDQVPIDGEVVGPRAMHWQPDAPATLYWLEALDGGDPIAEVPFRDVLMRASSPFEGPPEELFRAEHRVVGLDWGERGLLVVQQWERARRWDHFWQLQVDGRKVKSIRWYDLSENDRYGDPGHLVHTVLPNGRSVIRQQGDKVWFVGSGASPTGDRPFLDIRGLSGQGTERLFRSEPDAYERFVAFGPKGRLLIRRESPTEVPNFQLLTVGHHIQAEAGEASRTRKLAAVTTFPDPAPALRGIQQKLVTYTRADGVPLSFELMLPPGYTPGTPLPTVLYAYPREYSDPATAGQVRGSDQTFTEIHGPSHLFFLLRGYAVLHNTTMPVLGDPETAYDSFVEQLVADATAAIDKAVELGVTDRSRVGVMGHSHGALMTATLLAHTSLFKAGIARSGAYNHTIRPFGFQNERRTLWEAEETYLHLSPLMFAPQIRTPLLLIHGEEDENPGTIPFQSKLLFEAIRGTGGTVRLVMLPFEGHGYRAQESVEHVLAEQIAWFDTYVKGP